jgi:glycosyltransferase involved in cell wall biosynthesis
MAAGKSVVSTTKGVEGINVKDEENIVIADDAEKFIKKILFLLHNSEIAEKIGFEGLKLALNYSAQNIIQDFNRKLFFKNVKGR